MTISGWYTNIWASYLFVRSHGRVTYFLYSTLYPLSNLASYFWTKVIEE